MSDQPAAGVAGQGSDGSGDFEPDSESRSVYLRFRRVFGDGSSRSRDARRRASHRPGSSAPFSAGRDPEPLGSAVDALTAKLGWNSPLAQFELLASWPQVAGSDTAEHSTPVAINDGTLTVRCDSTAWATQLRLMRGQIVRRITDRFPKAGISTVRFEGPNVPSWKRGPRSIPGRGPRDTYG